MATKLLISASSQSATWLENGQPKKTFSISTSAKGLGSQEGSNKTPAGKFTIHSKFGHNAPTGTIFKSREPIGTWNPTHFTEEDLILTRILWLHGTEDHNANTKDRYIYLHGTNREDLLGTPASHGCVRFSNADIISIFNLLAEGDEVEIIA